MISAIYFEGDKACTMVKRFSIETTTLDQKFLFITDSPNSKLYFATIHDYSELQVTYKSGNEKQVYNFVLTEFIDVKGWKALGNRLTQFDLTGKVSEIVPEVKLDKKKTSEVKMGTTIELDVNPKAGKKGKQGDLF